MSAAVPACGRLPAARGDFGATLDRAVRLSFTFNGRSYTGHPGDTLASALLANGVRLVARSWKYHRPRGILSAGAEEPNALVQLGSGARTVPNVPATLVELYDGLEARSVNCAPSVEDDRLAWLGRCARFLPAGFYYKTFMWPAGLWMRYEHHIRKAAGLGEAPPLPDPDRYERRHAHCDVLVVGAGPAGLAAALAAGRAGARVILADENPQCGGSLRASRAQIGGGPALAWVGAAAAELAALPEVQVLLRTTVFGYHDHNFLTLQERLTEHLPAAAVPAPNGLRAPRERLWRVRAAQVVLATGAHERPLVFGDNDLPGVMLAGAVSTYLVRHGVAPGRTCVVFTNNDAAYQAALDLRAAGVAVAAVVDPRAAPGGALPRRVAAAGVSILAGSVVTRAIGGRELRAVQVMALDGEQVSGRPRRIDCDLLAVSGGYSPVIHLSAQSGATPVWSDAHAAFLPGPAVQAERSAGACRGTAGLGECLAEGAAAGRAAAQDCGHGAAALALPHAADLPQEPLYPLWLVPDRQRPGRGPKQFVDLQNDVAAADILLAAREGYHSIEHVKRYTALGFGTDQGKTGNINGMAILARQLGQTIAQTGTTRYRPNYTPITFGAIAGSQTGAYFDPVRQTPLHGWHAARGAPFENVGQWHRPWYYPRPGESLHAAVQREARAVRESVGIFDGSTLGKIDIQGPDAVVLLNRIYTNDWTRLAVGKCRYGLMLDENGMVMDDGVTTRLGEQHYLMTTTTGGAARVLAWMERWLQTEWPELRVYLGSVTDHWATIVLAGPHSRRVLQGACADIDCTAAAFPFMAYRAGTVASVAARVMRISFSGELAYEVNVPADHAQHVWTALMAAGEPLGITPYGTETMHLLRAEKGYPIIGQDTDGSVTPDDLGMGWAVAAGKDFLGKRSLARADTGRPGRKQLVGLYALDPRQVLPEGGQVVALDAGAPPVPMQGHVSSSYFSPTLQRSIALALVCDGRARSGQPVGVVRAGAPAIPARIGSPIFLDPQGARQDA